MVVKIEMLIEAAAAMIAMIPALIPRPGISGVSRIRA